jgi:GT2 family glycosyltransferase
MTAPPAATGATPTAPAASSSHGLVPVTAVVVTAGVTRYLARTLAALAAQRRRPARVLVVDVGGPEGVPALVDATFAAAGAPAPWLARTAAPGAASFGGAVAAGLATMDEALGEAPTPWLWLLHDDGAPEPGALAALVREVGRSPSVAIAGAKQRTWTDPERLLEAGLRTTRWGRRMTDVEPGELDQGQLDGRTDVLGVGLVGALVRREVWDALGGPDPALGVYGDGMDLSRRAHLAGHRVVVVPGAVVRHAQAGYHGLRSASGTEVDVDGDGEPDTADPRRSFAERRRSAVHARLVAAPWPLLPIVALVAVAAALVRCLVQVAAKQPGLAVAELTGGLGALVRVGAISRARRRAAATAAQPRRSLHALQATWRDVWTQAQDRRLARREARRVQRAPSELELRELAALATRRRATLAAVLVALVIASVVTFGGLLGPVVGGGARLSGGALALASSSFGELWSAATSGWVRAGFGQADAGDPLLTALAGASALVGGHLAVVVDVLVLGAVLLAGWGAWAGAGAATRSVGVRALAAVAWASAPALTLALGSGRLGAVLAHAALPWVAFGVARALGVQRVDQVVPGVATARAADDDEPATSDDETASAGDETAAAVRSSVDPKHDPARPERVGAPDPTGSPAAAAGAAIALAVAVAGAPVLLVPSVLGLLVVAAAARRRRGRLLLVPLPALVLLAPLLAEAASRGAEGLRLLVAEPGLSVAAAPAQAWQRLLGLPTSGDALVPAGLDGTLAEAWPVALGAWVLALAVLALLRGAPAARAVRVAWLVALLGAATATGVAALPAVWARGAAPDGTGAVVPAWTGAPLSLMLLGLLAAAVLGADRLTERLARSTFGWRQPIAVLLAGVTVLVVAAGLVGWARSAPTTSDLVATERLVVPAVAQEAQRGEASARVLALRAQGDAVAWTVLRSDGTQLVDVSAAAATGALTGSADDPAPGQPDAATTEVDALVARLRAGAGGDVAGPLAALGVGSVLVPPAAADGDSTAEAARADLVGRLDSTAGLERVTSNETGVLWRVQPVAEPDSDAVPEVVVAWARIVAGGADLTDPATAAVAVASQDRAIDTAVSAGDVGRVVVLAERADSGWHAWLDGVPLRSVQSGWRQTFELGASGGHLVVRYEPPLRSAWLGLLAVTTVLTALLAVPVRRRRAGR